MDISISDFEERIDVEYEFSDIVRIEKFGILMKDYRIIHFEQCAVEFDNPWEREMRGRKYVGHRNTLTEPQYMRFCEDRKNIILKFPDRETYIVAEAIRRMGYDTFDDT